MEQVLHLLIVILSLCVLTLSIVWEIYRRYRAKDGTRPPPTDRPPSHDD